MRAKVFACHHEQHRETTIAECLTRRDHDPALTVGAVRSWAVGVTVAPHRNATIAQSLKSLADAGWDRPRIFSEPETTLPRGLDPSLVTVRNRKLGAWPNWLLALHELVLTDPHADAYLMCQDDVLYCNGLRTYLEETLWPAGRLGVVSLHTAGHQDRGDILGYSPIAVGLGGMGRPGLRLLQPVRPCLASQSTRHQSSRQGPGRRAAKRRFGRRPMVP